MNRLKCIFSRYLMLFLCCFMIMTVFSKPVKAEDAESAPGDTETVRVGWYEDSYNTTGENGDRSGYNYEYEQTISGYTGWRYEYVNGDWSELLEKLENGDIDLMGVVSYTDDRAEKMLYSALPMGEERYYLYADLENTEISSSDLSSLNGKRVGLLEGSVQATQFSEWEEKNSLHTQHVSVSGVKEALEKVRNHDIDCVISTETPQWPQVGLSAITQVGSSDIYYVISKKRPDLKNRLDEAMRNIQSDRPFYADDLYKKYLSSVSSPVLSTDEKQWLNDHGSIRIGCLNNDPGVSVPDKKTGKLSGIVNDYINHVSDCIKGSDIEFEVVGFDTQKELIQALKDEKIDMIFHFTQNPYVAEENGFALSDTAWTYNMAAVTAKKLFDENDANTVAIAKDNLICQWFVSSNYPDWKIIETDSPKDAEAAVKNGQADCYIGYSGQLLNINYGNQFHSVPLTQPGNVSFAIRLENTALLSILNKTLRTMSSSILSGALSMYENAQRKITVADYIRNNLATVTFSFVLAVIVVFAMIFRLYRKARRAEAGAKAAQAEAERANAAKSAFLFGMSHDIRTPMNAILGYNQLMKKKLMDPKLLDYQNKIEQSGQLLLSIINNVLDMARIEKGKMILDEDYVQVEEIVDSLESVFDSETKEKGIRFTCTVNVQHPHIICDETRIEQIFVNLISNAIKYTPAGGTVTLETEELPGNKEGLIFIKSVVRDNGIGMSREFLPDLFKPFVRERSTTIGKVPGTGLGMPIVKQLVDMMDGQITVKSELGKGTEFTVIIPHKIADEKYYAEKPDLNVVVRKDILQEKHILLAEDNDLNAEITTAILEEMGITVERVEDGVQCVSRMETMPAGSYDLILMDVQMPNMDGYRAAEIIRRFPDRKKADIPIYAMSANAFEEDRKEALSKGMNGHIAKPIDIKRLEETLISAIMK